MGVTLPDETGPCVVCRIHIRPSHKDVLTNGRGALAHAACIRGKYRPDDDLTRAIRLSVTALIRKARGKVKDAGAPVEVRLEEFASAFAALVASRGNESGTPRVAIDALVREADELYFGVMGLKNQDGFGYLLEDVNATARRIAALAKEHLFRDLPLPRRPSPAYAPATDLPISAP
jgi:hypothetical protein